MFIAALYAMITVIIIVYIILFIHKLLFKKYLATNLKEELIFYLLSFIIGFIADIIIHKLNIFPKLKLYYSVIGSGLWGGLAILFSIFVSIQLLKYR